MKIISPLIYGQGRVHYEVLVNLVLGSEELKSF